MCIDTTTVAIRLGTIDKFAEVCQEGIIPADATSVSDLEHVFTRSIDLSFSGVYFILNLHAQHNKKNMKYPPNTVYTNP